MTGQASSPELSEKQQCFVAEYLVDLNATQAAIRAGYSAKTAEQQGSRLLSNVKVAAAVAAAQGARSARTEITQDMVLRELAKIGFSDIRRLFTEDGAIQRIEALDDNAAASLASVEVVRRRVPGSDRDDPEYEDVTKFKIWDKRAALVDIGRHLGMFTEKLEISGTVHIADAIARGRARVASVNGK